MAIINTYPTATPKGADLLIGTQVKDDTVLENSTKSFSVDALGSYIVTSTSGITGSGTLRQIPMFTPNGQAVGDSVMFQIPNNPWIQVGVVGVGQETVLGPGFVSTTALGVDNIIAIDGGSVTLNGNVIIGNADTDLLTVTSTSRFYNNVQLGSDTDDQIAVEGTLELQGPVKDHSANLPSSAGQILVAGTDGIVTWTDIAGISGSVTGSGTTNTIPVWTDGPNGVLGDSFITQTTSPDAVTISSRFIVSPNSILGLEVSQGAGKALVTISDNLKVDGTYYDAASDEGTDGDVLLAKGFPGNMVTRWTSLADAGITSGIETAQVTVTDAQIRTLGTVPVEILPAVTNKIYQIIGLTTQNIGNAGLTDSYDWSASGDGVFYGQGFASTQHRVEIPNSRLPQGGASLAPSGYVATPIGGDWKSGASVKLSTTTGVDPTIVNSPSAEMVVNVTYRLIELA